VTRRRMRANGKNMTRSTLPARLKVPGVRRCPSRVPGPFRRRRAAPAA
jgi:hypothetical protein